jgi:CheY-like chemotaxis protein
VCFTDPTRLEQVLVHLVVDAADSLPHGGRVVVATSNVAPFDDASSRVALVVTAHPDEGADPSPAAPGLGCEIAGEIVRRSGGLLTVEPSAAGLRIRAELPRSDAPVPRRSTPAGGERLARGTGTILLVDDEKTVLDVTSQVLRSAGYEVLAAHGSDAAVRLSREHPGRIDLLLTDVVMPGLAGPRLARRLLEERPDMRLLFMSAYADEAFSLDDGPDPDALLVEKPFDSGRLTRAIREVLG